MTIHVVSAGESLYSISLSYGVSVEQLATDNGLGDPNDLVVGQTLVIRTPQETYTVRTGDTLSGIARTFGLPLNELYRNNPSLHGEPELTPGQTLVLRYVGEPIAPLAVLGYAYPNIATSLLRSTLPHLTYLAPFTHGISSDGGLIAPEDAQMLQLSEQYGVAPVLHLSTIGDDGTFHSEIAALLLGDEVRQARLIGEIGKALYQKGYQGIDVDFEYIYPEDAANYAAFIRLLTSTFNPYGIPVTVALAPKASDDQPGLLYEGHDYRALGAAANSVLLMTYEWGYAYSEPRAVAPLPNVEQVVSYALTRIPAEKILLGIPNYGYDWTLPYVSGITRAESISNVEAVQLARTHHAEILFDEISVSPYFTYYNGETAHTVHFEDARSIQAKLHLALEHGLYGVGYWNFNRPFPQNLRLLASLCEILPS